MRLIKSIYDWNNTTYNLRESLEPGDRVVFGLSMDGKNYCRFYTVKKNYDGVLCFGFAKVGEYSDGSSGFYETLTRQYIGGFYIKPISDFKCNW